MSFNLFVLQQNSIRSTRRVSNGRAAAACRIILSKFIPYHWSIIYENEDSSYGLLAIFKDFVEGRVTDISLCTESNQHSDENNE